MSKLTFPIRLKVLITVLAFLMIVVGVITVTMADLFHEDKTTYVRDFSAAVTTDIKTEIDTILGGYVSASTVLSEVLFADYVDPNAKQRLIEPIFVAYPQIMAMVTHSPDGEPISIYNAATLQAVGTDSDELLTFASYAEGPSSDAVRVQGAKLRSGQNVVTLLLEQQRPNEVERRAVITVLTPELFHRVLNRAGAFEALLIDATGKDVMGTVEGDNGWAHAAQEHFSRLEAGAMGVIDISDDGIDYFAGVANVAIGDLSIATRISVSAAYLTARNLLNNLVIVGLIIVLVAAIGGAMLTRRFTLPLERLSRAVRKVAKGNFDVNVEIESRDEIGHLSISFNEMADELQEREQSLKSAQLALVQSEKMAAVGTLSAGLAHEVKNPLSAVLGYAQLSKRKLEQPEVVRKHLDTIESETRRCNEIIGNLMQFSRQEKGEFSEVSINDVVEKSMSIVDHQLSLKGVRMNANLAPDIPDITGNPNQLQQVLMNLAINAQQAMQPDGGTVDLETYYDDSFAYVAVSDTGPGVSAEIAEKIFEPFYTTKAAGEGTGLGLSVTYGIVQDHKGDIRIEQSESGGARFVIQIPIKLTRELAATTQFSLEQVS